MLFAEILIHLAVVALGQQLLNGGVLPVVHIRGSPPTLDQCGRVERRSTIMLILAANVMHLQVGVERLGMTVGAADLFIEEQLLAPLGGRAESAFDQVLGVPKKDRDWLINWIETKYDVKVR